MKKVRIIPRLEIKSRHVIKGIRMEGLRQVGLPEEMCIHYFDQGADEIFFVDTVASLYGRNHLADLVSMASERIFVPLGVGGGIRCVEDFHALLCAGADKITLNTQAITTPELITKAANVFGSQCVIVSIQAKRQNQDYWEAYTLNGRERVEVDALAWAKEAESRGAGEILLTSIDRDGTKKGMDIELIQNISAAVKIPVIAAGGVGSVQHIIEAVNQGGANAVALSNILHFGIKTIRDIKRELLENDIQVRTGM